MDFSSMNVIDLIFLVIFIISLIVGLVRGLVREVLSLIAWVAAIWLAWRFAPFVAEQYISQFFDDPIISYFLAFGSIFIVSLFGIGLLNLLIGMMLSTTGLLFIDRMMGMVFGILRAVVILSLVVFFGRLTPVVQETWWQESKAVPYFSSFADWGVANLPQEVQSLLEKFNERRSPSYRPAGFGNKSTAQGQSEGQLSPITLELLRQPNMQQWLAAQIEQLDPAQRRRLEQDLKALPEDTAGLTLSERQALQRLLQSFSNQPAHNAGNSGLQLESLQNTPSKPAQDTVPQGKNKDEAQKIRLQSLDSSR